MALLGGVKLLCSLREGKPQLVPVDVPSGTAEGVAGLPDASRPCLLGKLWGGVPGNALARGASPEGDASGMVSVMFGIGEGTMGVRVGRGKGSRAGGPGLSEPASTWGEGTAMGESTQGGEGSTACTPTLTTSDTGMVWELTAGSSRTKLGGGVADGE